MGAPVETLHERRSKMITYNKDNSPNDLGSDCLSLEAYHDRKKAKFWQGNAENIYL